jgi:hypothetical protein
MFPVPFHAGITQFRKILQGIVHIPLSTLSQNLYIAKSKHCPTPAQLLADAVHHRIVSGYPPQAQVVFAGH